MRERSLTQTAVDDEDLEGGLGQRGDWRVRLRRGGRREGLLCRPFEVCTRTLRTLRLGGDRPVDGRSGVRGRRCGLIGEIFREKQQRLTMNGDETRPLCGRAHRRRRPRRPFARRESSASSPRSGRAGPPGHSVRSLPRSSPHPDPSPCRTTATRPPRIEAVSGDEVG